MHERLPIAAGHFPIDALFQPAASRIVFGMLFESVSMDEEGVIKEVEPQPWARLLFANLLIVTTNPPRGDYPKPRRRQLSSLGDPNTFVTLATLQRGSGAVQIV